MCLRGGLNRCRRSTRSNEEGRGRVLSLCSKSVNSLTRDGEHRESGDADDEYDDRRDGYRALALSPVEPFRENTRTVRLVAHVQVSSGGRGDIGRRGHLYGNKRRVSVDER